MRPCEDIPDPFCASDPKEKSIPRVLSNIAMLAAVSAMLSPLDGKLFMNNLSDNVDPHATTKASPSLEELCGIRRELPIFHHTDSESDFWKSFLCCSRSSKKKKKKNARSPFIPPLQDRLSLLPVDSAVPLLTAEEMFFDQSTESLLNQVSNGLSYGPIPKLIDDGMGGVYVIYDQNSTKIAVFKPGDEEVGCFDNPKGHSPKRGVTDVRDGIAAGSGMFREIAAYVLDSANFVGVPPTSLARCYFDGRAKVGSVQTFIPSESTSGDFGYSVFPTLDVQKIAMFDMRILNRDRHDGNILVQRNGDQYHLVPIDHGLCLPSRLEVSSLEWCWMSWPQIDAPVHPEIRKYILSLDVNSDIEKLNSLGLPLPDASIRNLRITTAFLKLAVLSGLTLLEMATCLARDGVSSTVASPLEKVVLKAKWRSAALSTVRALPFDKVFDSELEHGLIGMISSAKNPV